jgi:hypothetical protein
MTPIPRTIRNPVQGAKKDDRHARNRTELAECQIVDSRMLPRSVVLWAPAS